MLKILFPTDFSDSSNVALNFAIQVANKLDGKITLLHVVTVAQAARATTRFRLGALEEEMVRTAKEDMQSLIHEISGKIKSSQPLSYDVKQGSTFETAVKNEAIKLTSDLIIVGTHGASGVKKVILGSNAASVIEVSPVPVLVVPEQAAFNGFKNLVCATDLKNPEEGIKALRPYLDMFGSMLHMFHVVTEEDKVAAAEEKIQAAAVASGYSHIKTKVVVSKELDKAVEAYIKESNGDLLATFPHAHGFFDKLFNRSLTRTMTFQSNLPMLIFRHA